MQLTREYHCSSDANCTRVGTEEKSRGDLHGVDVMNICGIMDSRERFSTTSPVTRIDAVITKSKIEMLLI
jgi:hypothetical protein